MNYISEKNPGPDEQFRMYVQLLQQNPENNSLSTHFSQINSQNTENEPENCTQNPSNFSHSTNYSQTTLNLDENEEGENDEVVEIRSSTNNSSRKRATPKNSWSNAEDAALISSFMAISEDACIGTGQTGRDLWVRVKNLYEEARQSNTQLRERSSGMLGSRFRRIAAGVMKFVGCYEAASRDRTSGMNEKDVISKARSTHQASFGNFKFEECWYLLNKYKKWESHVVEYSNDVQVPNTSSGSGQRSFDNVTPSGEGASSKRPMGCKAAKKSKANAGKDVDNSNAEYLADTLKEFNEVQKNKMELAKQKETRKQKQLEYDFRKLDLDEKNSKMTLLQALLSRSHLSSQDEELKMKLLKDVGMI